MAMFMAQDTFSAELKDGTPVLVTKGSLLHERHELVLRDKAGTGQLFKAIDDGEPPEKAAKAPARGGK